MGLCQNQTPAMNGHRQRAEELARQMPADIDDAIAVLEYLADMIEWASSGVTPEPTKH
jgi:hypothetical protein